jgi:hypothetical protein
MASATVHTVVLALGMSLVACGRVENSPASDAATRLDSTRSSTGGADAGKDAGTDAGKDSAADAGKDAGTDAGKDSAVDAGKDAGTDAGRDTGTDANACAVDGGTCGGGITCCSRACVDEQTDPNNCGACGNVCSDGPSPACGDGICNYTLATGQLGLWLLAVDSTSVYWSGGAGSNGFVMKVPLGGGSPTTLASGQVQPSGIAVDATNVYWADVGYIASRAKEPS